jgi:hypothetical protein
MALATVTAAVGLAGCGRSSSSTSSSITASAWKARIDKLCATNNAQVKAVPAAEANTIARIEKLDAIATGTVNEIKAIPIPSSIQSSAQEWVNMLDQLGTKLNTMIVDLKAGKSTQGSALAAQANSLDARASARAKALGLPSCAAEAQPGGS